MQAIIFGNNEFIQYEIMKHSIDFRYQKTKFNEKTTHDF